MIIIQIKDFFFFFFWGGGGGGRGRREGQWYRAKRGVGIEFRAIILINDIRYVSYLRIFIKIDWLIQLLHVM